MQPKTKANQSRRGTAMLSAMAILTLVSVMVLGFFTMAVDTTAFTRTKFQVHRAKISGESLMALAVDNLWGGYLVATPVANMDLASFRTYLDGRGVAGSVAGLPLLAPIDITPSLGLAGLAGDQFDNAVVEQLSVQRIDLDSQTRLIIDTTVNVQPDTGQGFTGVRKSLRRVYAVNGAEWNGTDFALLANNLNCILCHAEVDNADRFYNNDPSLHGSFDRVKVASLDNFQIREDPMSWIAGSLYLAGQPIDDDGDLITNWATLNLRSRDFTPSGTLVEGIGGVLTETTMIPSDPMVPDPSANLFLNMDPASPAGLASGMPSSFPPPFPDNGGIDLTTGAAVTAGANNRILDPEEFHAVAVDATGSITGGHVSLSPIGSVIADTTALTNFMTTPTQVGMPSSTTGNVYLYGTVADPIVIDGIVAIDGDVIIHGVVQGLGSLKVSGNVYVPGDLLYADDYDAFGNRSFGLDASGGENGISIASGGNISIGDVFHPQWGEATPTTGSSGGSFNFIMDELALFNRMEWLKTKETLPGKTVRTVVGTEERSYMHQPKVWVLYVPPPPPSTLPPEYAPHVPLGYWDPVGAPYLVTYTANIYDYVTPQLPNPNYQGTSYIPRFYNFSEGKTIPIFDRGYWDPVANSWQAKERVGSWSNYYLDYADPTDPTDPYLFNADGSPKAVVESLTTSAGWMPDHLLDKMITDVLGARDPLIPLEINGVLYSNNSVFGLVPARNSPGVDGEMILNGSILAPDIGMLAPNKLQLNFDTRAGRLLEVEDARGMFIQLISESTGI